nr:hypothetical protein [Thalassovita sp.]
MDAYVAAGMSAMWEQNQKMDDPQVFVQMMNQAGLDGAALLDRTQSAAVKARLVANTEARWRAACSVFRRFLSAMKCSLARNGWARSKRKSTPVPDGGRHGSPGPAPDQKVYEKGSFTGSGVSGVGPLSVR